MCPVSGGGAGEHSQKPKQRHDICLSFQKITAVVGMLCICVISLTDKNPYCCILLMVYSISIAICDIISSAVRAAAESQLYHESSPLPVLMHVPFGGRCCLLSGIRGINSARDVGCFFFLLPS